MQDQKVITPSDQEQDQVSVDLSFLYLENKINEFWTKKGWPTHLRVRDVGDDAVWIGIGMIAPPCAIFVRSAKTLIRTESKGIRWGKTKSAFIELIPGLKIIE